MLDDASVGFTFFQEVPASARVDLDLLNEFTNTIVISLFHNRMWQSGYSEVDVNLV